MRVVGAYRAGRPCSTGDTGPPEVSRHPAPTSALREKMSTLPHQVAMGYSGHGFGAERRAKSEPIGRPDPVTARERGGADDAAAPRGTGACSAALVRRTGRVGPSRGAGYGSRRLRHAEARRHRRALRDRAARDPDPTDRKSTRLNSSHQINSYAVFCLKKKKTDAPSAPRAL